jgi:hypothetical protein
MKDFIKTLYEQAEVMYQTGKLFKSSISGHKVWELYLNNFSADDDPIFRDPNSSTHNCDTCHNFIKRYGNIVTINENYEIITLFDTICEEEYVDSARVISDTLKNAPISEVFFETFEDLTKLPYESCKKTHSVFRLGVKSNHKQYSKEESEKFGVVKPEEIIKFNHLYLDLPKEFVIFEDKSIESVQANYRDAKNVFKRSMEEISLDTLTLVKDLINQGSLLNGQTHLFKVEQMIPFAQDYQKINFDKKDDWCWIKSYQLPFAKFKNELIGVLCTELAEGEDLNKACQNWNKRVDPVNYMKAVAPITKKQIEHAKKFVEENEYTESFDRRLATIDDIKTSEILHLNSGDGKLKEVSIFENVKATSTQHKRNEFSNVEEVSIEKFMKDILPSCSSIEAYLENRLENNMVSLTTSNVKNSKSIFKWNNNYSWTFNGNLAGKSQIKEAVKSRGGNIDGVLRISLAFPNTTDDYDLHLIESNNNHISYSNVGNIQPSSGVLDLDAQGADGHQEPDKRVENIVYTDKNKMPVGEYEIFIKNFSGRGFHTKFTIEIEIDGDVTLLELKQTSKSNIANAIIIKYDGNNFELIPDSNMVLLESKIISKEIYGLDSNQFHKTNLVCLSPNHWDDNNIGNKHYFFMLENCKVPTSIRSFHSENLIPELAEHRKVLEVLGNTTMIEPTNKQLSGLGFNATIHDELIVKLQGSHKRMLKIKF